MINLSNLNKLLFKVIFFTTIIFNLSLAEDEPVDIWKNNENENNEAVNINKNAEKDIAIKSPILSENINKIKIKIDENEIEEIDRSVIGIFDPQVNNFNLNMWSQTDGEDIKTVLNRINKLKLSETSEDLLFQVLFTNSYSPKKNLNPNEFLKIKIDWLIKNKRIRDLELLLKNNPDVGKNSKATKFLIDEYLSSADIKSACEKIDLADLKIKNIYLEKLTIYCLINDDRKEEAQLFFELLTERGFKDSFYEDKINFLLGITSTNKQKILDDNLLNFYLSYITSENFEYQPNEKTNQYIWKFLSSAKLIKVNDFEDEEVILTYENAAALNAFKKDEIFKIYLKMNFNFNQLVNSKEIYKNLPNYMARGLIYQSMLLSDNVERKIELAFLLKDLFNKDKMLSVYTEEMSSILKSIDQDLIPANYIEAVDQNIDVESAKKIKFDNEIIHRSKIIKHFIDNNEKNARTENDFKSVYKKIKKNKKYFVSIKDIVVLESLAADGVVLPSGLNYSTLASELTIPKNLQDLVRQNQLGLVMLKIVEIIGEDEIKNLDPETLYFLNRILNDLNLKKIRNKILSESLPLRI